MTHTHRRSTSRFPYFRMDVPKDIRDLAGVTSWQHSLGTMDGSEAAARRAHYTAHYKSEIIRLRAIHAGRTEADAKLLVGRAFDALANHFRSMNVAVAGELQKVALIVRSSWSLDDAAMVETEQFGEARVDMRDEEPEPIPAIEGEDARRHFRTAAALLESTEQTSGVIYQQLASALLARSNFRPLEFAVSYLPYLVREIDLSTPAKYDAIARAYLTRLAEHEFTSWPKDLRQALRLAADPPLSAPAPAPSPVAQPAAMAGYTLQHALTEWKRQKRIVGGNKTADEFATAVARFEALIGVGDIALITRRMVKQFRDQVAKLPARGGKQLRSLPPSDQVARAEAEGLPTLSPPTVAKQIAGIKAVLAAAVEAEWIEANPAERVTVEGAKWEGDERDHFSDEDMRRIYTAPLMTDPDACDDTMFWILFLAPFHGSRPSEHCKLKPNEIVQENGRWVMRFRRDRPRRRNAGEEASHPRRQKTRSSVRDVPLHRTLIDAGFIDFVHRQQQRGAEWLFDDLTANAYGNRYQALSQRINRALRKLGITDADKAFYSSRHTMKREGRRQGIDRHSLDQLTGHASSRVGDRYGQGSPVETLKEDIDRLEFRSVPWQTVIECAQARLRRLSAGS